MSLEFFPLLELSPLTITIIIISIILVIIIMYFYYRYKVRKNQEQSSVLIKKTNEDFTDMNLFNHGESDFNTGISPFDEQMMELYNQPTNNIKDKQETEKFEMDEYEIQKIVPYKPIKNNQKSRLYKIKCKFMKNDCDKED
jgi:hypothetical protein